VEEGLFSLERVNGGRQIELDIAKGFAIAFMVLVHCLEELSALELTRSTYVIQVLGRPFAAPVFMFALGVGLVYSRRSSARDLALRGVRTLILAYVLNLVRDSLPLMVLWKRTGDPELLHEAVVYLFGVDILSFAGLVFLFFAAAKALKFKLGHYIVSGIIMSGANMVLLNYVPQSTVLNVFLGSFWGTNENTWFPFLTWIVYPLSGYVFGQYLIRCRDKKRLYTLTLQGCLSVLGLFVVYSLARESNLAVLDYIIMDIYYHHDIVGFMFIISVALSWISALYLWSPHIPQLITGTLSRWSKNITTLYCVHWLIVGWTYVVVESTLTLPWVLVCSVVLLAVSDFISDFYLKTKSRMLEQGQISARPH
jgi:uncharacterized membrane protein